MTCRHRRGTTSFPPPATRRPQRRHPPSTPRARSPPRTAADPLAGPPAGGPATAGPAYQSPALPSLSDVPSQHLAFEVLRRLVESALSVNLPPVARRDRPSSGTDTVASPSPSTVNVAFVVPLRGWAASPSDIAKTYACPQRYLVSVVTVVETPETVTASPGSGCSAPPRTS